MEFIKTYRKALLVNGLFVAIFLAMLVLNLRSYWAWGIFTVVWIGAEWRFAKPSPIKLWHWALLIGVLALLGAHWIRRCHNPAASAAAAANSSQRTPTRTP